MKTKFGKYKAPSNGFTVKLGFEEVTTIKMALENKLRHDRRKQHSVPIKSKNFWRKEARYAIRALRGIERNDIYVH